jgi:Bacteriophage Sf6, terminase small subunit-like
MSARASRYSAEIAERILTGLKGGRTLRALCREDGMPRQSTVQGWVLDDREGFAARYKAAREIGNPGMRSNNSVYTAAIAERILEELRRGGAISVICQEPGMPAVRTVTGWVRNDCEGFTARYLEARAVGQALMARFTLYTPEIAEHLLAELCRGRTLTDICSDPGMPSIRTVQQWTVQDREGFKARYREAREFSYHLLFDQTRDISDDRRKDWILRRRNDGTSEAVLDQEHISRSRLRCEVRDRHLSRLLPKALGDQLNLNARPGVSDDVAALMKLIDESPRELPSARLLTNKTETG